MRVDYDADVHDPLMDVYGQTVTFRPLRSQPGAAAVVMQAIFDCESEVILQEVKNSEIDAPGHSTSMPVLTVRLADLAARPRQGDEADAGGETWVVWYVQADGRGMADLILRKKRGS